MLIENHPCAAFHFILYEFRFEKITEFGFTISVSEYRLTIESLGSNEICSVIKVYMWWMVRFSFHRSVPNKFGLPSANVKAESEHINFPNKFGLPSANVKAESEHINFPNKFGLPSDNVKAKSECINFPNKFGLPSDNIKAESDYKKYGELPYRVVQ